MRSVAVVGATASGKSAVAFAAAEALGTVELVSVDAMQVYPGMDIGTAKPTVAERSAVPHHLIDLVDPDEEFTIAEFQTAGVAALAGIAERGHDALLVGGTGLYLRALIDRLELPGSWPEVRAMLEAEPDTAVLHRQLADLDPLAAARIEPGNHRRVVRALEVCLGSGQPFSSFGPGLDHYPPIDTVQIGVRWDRATLTERIEQRVTLMLAAGLFAEAGELHARGSLSRTARQALGYRELFDHLDGRCSFEEAVAAIVADTRRFAVRQDRWFRRDPRIRWVDVEADPVAEVAPIVIQAFRR